MAENPSHGRGVSICAADRATLHTAVGDLAARGIPIGGGLLVIGSLLVGVLSVAGCSPPATPPLRVFAAAGAKPAIDEAARSFEQERGQEVEVSYGAGGEVLARMVFLERGDVYIAPEQQFMQGAARQGAVDPLTIRDLAYLIPVLAVQKGNPRRVRALSDLARPGMRVGVTRPETTCLGRIASQVFQRARLAEAIAENVVVQALRPDQLTTWLVLGEVDAVFTWHFYGDLAPDDIEVIWLPPEQLSDIGKMQVAETTYAESRQRARSFVEFLTSSAGRTIFERHGYLVDTEELSKYWHAVGGDDEDPGRSDGGPGE
jgi:molybdate transport system substrate-binding protein